MYMYVKKMSIVCYSKIPIWHAMTYDMMQSKFQRNFSIWNKFIGAGNGEIGANDYIQCPPLLYK